jgi:3-hydroxyisobutyrate dehydrogenase
MATRIAQSFDVLCYDLNAERVELATEVSRREPRLQVASDISHLGRDCTAIVSCLPKSDHVAAALASLLRSLAEGADVADAQQQQQQQRQKLAFNTWIDCSSGSARESQRLSSLLWDTGERTFVDCGVSGGPAGATAGSLTAMVGSKGSVLSSDTRDVLNAFASKVVVCGGAGAGHAVKATNNALLAANLWAASELLANLQACDIDIDVSHALDAINGGSGRSWVTQNRFDEYIMQTPRRPYGFALDMLGKDVSQTIELFEADQLPCEHISAVHANLLAASDALNGKGFEDLQQPIDHIEVATLFERNAGTALK